MTDEAPTCPTHEVEMELENSGLLARFFVTEQTLYWKCPGEDYSKQSHEFTKGEVLNYLQKQADETMWWS